MNDHPPGQGNSGDTGNGLAGGSSSRGQRVAAADLVTPLYGLLALGILYTLYVAHQILLPIVLAVMTSLLLYPLVIKARQRLRIPKVISSLILVLLVLAFLAGIGMTVATPALKWIEKAPQGISRVLMGESELKRQLDRVSQSAEQVEKSMEEFSESGDGGNTVVLQTNSWRSQLISKAGSGLFGLVLALALTYFLLVSGDRLIQNLIRQLPNGQRRAVLQMTRDSQRQIAQYLAILGASNVLIGVATGLISWAVGLPDPAVWGLVAGLSRFIPYLGVITATTLLALVSVSSLDAFWMMVVAPAAYVALTSLVALFVEPWIYGFRMAINPVIIFVAIFFWGWLWGPVGVLLAVPLMTVIQVILKQIPRLRPVYRVIAR